MKLPRITAFVYLFLIISSFSYPSATADQDPPYCPDCKVLDQFEEFRKSISESLNTPTLSCSLDESAKCDFVSMCKEMSKNADAGYVLGNSSGQGIPNFRLWNLELELASCYSDLLNKPREKVELGEPIEVDPKELEERKKKIQVAVNEFKTSITENHEEETWLKLSAAAVELYLDLISKPEGMGMFGLTKKEIEENIRELEEKSGISLSDASREKYVSMIYIQRGEHETMALFDTPPSVQWELLNKNPFLNSSLLTTFKYPGGTKEGMLRYREKYQEGLNRSFKIFKETKAQILKHLESKITPENKNEIKQLMLRIQTVKMGMNRQSCDSPNAFYNSNDHTFNLCSQLYEYPDLTLKMIIAHELGHSIDPCTLTGPLVSITGEKRELSSWQQENDKRMKEFDEANDYFRFTPEEPEHQESMEYSVKMFGTYWGVASVNYKEPIFADVSRSIPYSKHPFRTILECLQTKKSVDAHAPTLKDFTQSLDQVIEKLKESGATEGNSKELREALETKKNAPKVFEVYGACGFLREAKGNSQLQEAFSDHLAAEIVADDLSSKKKQSAAKGGVMDMAGFFLSMSCPGMEMKLGKKVDTFFKEHPQCARKGSDDLNTLLKTFEAKGRMEDVHPWDVDRINRILLAHPKIRSYQGCAPNSEVRYCQ